MRLFHFTSAAHLSGIHLHGLTVGDVPTDLSRGKGKIGVWLTTDDQPNGHGLGGAKFDKKEVRLTIDVHDESQLHLWDTWAATNATDATRVVLEKTDGDSARTWYVYFGWIKRGEILEAVSMADGNVIEDWSRYNAGRPSMQGVPYWRRVAWQKQMLKKVSRAIPGGKANAS